MNFNLNEKCLLNYICELQKPSHISLSHTSSNSTNSNLTTLLQNFGVKIKTINIEHSNQVYEIIESFDYQYEKL